MRPLRGHHQLFSQRYTMGEMLIKLNATDQRILIVTVGIRLKKERNRLGLTQTAFAAACEVSKRSQIQFEQDEHVPGGGLPARR